MKLLEYQGKELFKKYGIPVPKGELIEKETQSVTLRAPLVLKSQVPVGDRKKESGILFVESADESEFKEKKDWLLQHKVSGFLPEVLLAEEKVQFEKELYVSFSYDTDRQGPVFAVSDKGGSGIAEAHIFPVDLIFGLTDFYLRDVLSQARIPATSALKQVIQCLWALFEKEKALLAEINPLFQLQDGRFVAGDAKVILDDNVVSPETRPYVELDGDIAILASGGGASMLNLDILMRAGGKPANYVEYSGNPPASVVEELTLKVLSKPGLKGCWVVGGTANFTDIYETLSGFIAGLRKINPKPTYPIVIRRDGPRREEAFAMLKKVGEKEDYNFHVYGPETSMSDSAQKIVELSRE